MAIAFGVVVAVFIALLVIGGVTGRVKLKSCCAIADPRLDLRMRDAYADATPPAERDPAIGVNEDRPT